MATTTKASKSRRIEEATTPVRAERVQQPVRAERVQEPVRAERVQAQVRALEGWRLEGERRIERTYALPSRESALRFADYVGAVAIDLGVMPEIHICSVEVTIVVSSEGGALLQRDLDFARAIDHR